MKTPGQAPRPSRLKSVRTHSSPLETEAHVEVVEGDERRDLPHRGRRVVLGTLLDRHGLEHATDFDGKRQSAESTTESNARLTSCALHTASSAHALVHEPDPKADVNCHLLFLQHACLAVLHNLRERGRVSCRGATERGDGARCWPSSVMISSAT